MESARAAAERAYAPYSSFRVGAALLCADGAVVTGCNVENRSYGLTICAERSALGRAIAEGRRSFVALAVFCADADYAVSPCGACRQVISEFVGGDFPVYFAGRSGEAASATMAALLPFDALRELSRKRGGEA